MRHAISIPAGITKMSFLRFTTLTALAIIPWSIIFIYLGEKLGENWENINDVADICEIIRNWWRHTYCFILRYKNGQKA